jgi:hypothetical protein
MYSFQMLPKANPLRKSMQSFPENVQMKLVHVKGYPAYRNPPKTVPNGHGMGL